LKAHKLLPILRAALLADQAKHAIGSNLEPHTKAAAPLSLRRQRPKSTNCTQIFLVTGRDL
jgi:hypothetical protein